MAQKTISQALNDFANVLVEQELEPIRLDLIRVENEAKEAIEEIQKTIGNDINETILGIQESIGNEFKDALQNAEAEFNKTVSELQHKIGDVAAAIQEEKETPQSVDDEKFYILKDAIESLAVKASEALAEGFSDQEEQYTEICGQLDSKISVLERKVTQSNSELVEGVEDKITEIEKKLEEIRAEIFENVGEKITAIEKMVKETSEKTIEELSSRISKIEKKFKNLAEFGE